MKTIGLCFFVICGFALFSGQASTSLAASRIDHSRFKNASAGIFDKIGSVSDDYLCGSTADGNTKCVGWDLGDKPVPETTIGFSDAKDIVVGNPGICGYDADGLKCIRENRENGNLRTIIQSLKRGTVKFSTDNICGVSSKTAAIECFMTRSTELSRNIYRVETPNAVITYDINNLYFCWAESDGLRCTDQARPNTVRKYAFSNPTEVAASTMICARNQTEGACWDNRGNRIALSRDFIDAKKWLPASFRPLCAISLDDRLICVDQQTGTPALATENNIPAAFASPGSGLKYIFADQNGFMCASTANSKIATCWDTYASAANQTFEYSDTILSFLGSWSDGVCALLKSGMVECRTSDGVTARSLPKTSEFQVRPFYNQESIAWNETAIDSSLSHQVSQFKIIRAFDLEVGGTRACVARQSTGSVSLVSCVTPDQVNPETPFSLINVSALSTNANSSCAISDGGLACWGQELNGEARPVSFIEPIKVIVSKEHACAIDKYGLVCWGDLTSRAIPSGLDQPGSVTDFALGVNRTCALLSNKTVKCWGPKKLLDADPPANLADVTTLLGSREHVFCAVNPTGTHCWGGDTAFPE